MLRSCKGINLRDPRIMDQWIRECIGRHHKRFDFQAMMCDFGNPQGFYASLPVYDKMILDIGQYVADSITARRLELKPVSIRERRDGSSGKIRQIGCESALQQIFDYVAKGASHEIWARRIVPQQVSSIRDRGPIVGVKMIRGWIDADNAQMEYRQRHGMRYSSTCRLHTKLDCQKCFPHGDKEKFIAKFEKDCANQDLVWLWDALLSTHRVGDYHGFLIGALTSEWAMQYLLSFAYREIMAMHNRRGAQLITHALWYMDDALLIGKSRGDMMAAIDHITEYCAQEIGQIIKPDWQILPLKDHPIDMMGYLLYRSGRNAIRDRNWIKTRRLIIRSDPDGLSFKQAQRIMSYKGYIDNSNNYRINTGLKVQHIYRQARGALRKGNRNADESLLYR